VSTLLFIGELALAFGGMLFAGLLFNVLLFPEMWRQDDVSGFIRWLAGRP
jgi:hypothetical protein